MPQITSNIEYVLRMVEERDIHFVQFWFTDVLGNLKSFAATPLELEDALTEGVGFDGSSIEGFASREESDCVAMPNPDTFQILPWRPQQQGAARMFCDVQLPGGEPYEGDSRAVLKRITEAAFDAGYILNISPAIEHFYFTDSSCNEPLDCGGYYDLMPLDSGNDLRRDTVLMLEHMGIPVEFSHHEAAPSQHEIDLRYADALSMADAVMTHRLVVKEVARSNGCYASFMPKPIEGVDGSGMHLHLSLFDLEDTNLFYDPNDELGYQLSDVAKHFMAGLLAYAPEYCLLTNQYVNSYKRFVDGFDAPLYVTWAQANRSALVRVPHYKAGKALSSRLDLRNPDPACNPYLAFAAILSAGLRGIENGIELPPAQPRDILSMSPEAIEKAGIKRLPQNLGTAIAEFEKSELMREVLGDHIFDYIVRAKRAEWNEYCSHVGTWELDRYLPVL
ncbi:MAG: glutamine synthetase [Coriobacteriales bacterium]|nr:glutamine synthetase [Coriobacteriales bacterium]